MASYLCPLSCVLCPMCLPRQPPAHCPPYTTPLHNPPPPHCPMASQICFFCKSASDILKVFVLQNIYNFFSTSMKSVFCINSNIFFDNALMLTKIYNLFSVEYFIICISKSFMRPRFCFLTLFMQRGGNLKWIVLGLHWGGLLPTGLPC